MKEIHRQALKEIESRYGSLEHALEEDSGLQLGWIVNLGEEKVTFNFTTDAIRVFRIEPLVKQSKFKGLEELRQCAKRAGLEQLVYYGISQQGEYPDALALIADKVQTDGLDDIDQFYKTHMIEQTDALGGSLRRIGSRRR